MSAPLASLAVWSDARSSLEELQGLQGSGYDVYGALLDGDGNVVVRSIVIEEGPGHQERPCVAWNGEHFLVAWVEGWVVAFATNDSGLRAVHVLSDGTVPTPGGLQFSSDNTGDIDIAFAQGECLIVRDGNQCAPQGFRFSPTMAYLGTSALPFADELATDGTNFLVVDTNDALWPPALQAVLVDPALNVLAGPIAATPRTELAPAFLPNGTQSLLAVSTLRSDTPLGSYRVGIRRLDGGGCQPDLGFGGPGTAQLSVCGDVLASGGAAHLAVPGGGASAHTVYAQAVYLDLALPEFVGFTSAVAIEVLP